MGTCQQKQVLRLIHGSAFEPDCHDHSETSQIEQTTATHRCLLLVLSSAIGKLSVDSAMKRLPRGLLFFCFFVAGVLCFTVTMLIPELEEVDLFQFQRPAIVRHSRSFSNGTDGSRYEILSFILFASFLSIYLKCILSRPQSSLTLEQFFFFKLRKCFLYLRSS